MAHGDGVEHRPTPAARSWTCSRRSNARSGQTVAYWEHQKADGIKKNLVSWNYWRLLLELQKGVSYPAVYGNVMRNALTDPEFRAAYDFTK